MRREEHQAFRDLCCQEKLSTACPELWAPLTPEGAASLAELKAKLKEEWVVTKLLGTSLAAEGREQA